MLDQLNDKQYQAVTLPECNALILAGAGSGKTRVLVQRIAYLMQNHGIAAHKIMAVTFTNKAAQEMRSRIENLIGMSAEHLWVGTFHGIAHRLLRLHWQEAGLPQTFQVLDSDDQYRMIRRVLKDMNLDEKHFPPRTIQHFINGQKDDARRSTQVKARDRQQSDMIEIYQSYEALCQQNGVLDFAELLLKAYELWVENPALLADYQTRFNQVMVDEFQDTNRIQYLWLKTLVGESNNLMVVGDDDQSIYGWRGAQVENINHFQNDFAPVEVVRLEQNYRSTETILKAANTLVAHNSERMGKSLWTAGAKGDPISMYAAFNELEEANFVIGQVKRLHEDNVNYRDMAIFYRSNAQSRVLEEALMTANIPYRVYGGLRFFERAEIKNALAYCRLVYSREDDTAFERIVNVPTRGIGDRTVEVLRDYARNHHCHLWQAAIDILEQDALKARAANALQAFVDLIVRLTRDTTGHVLYEQVEHVVEHCGLIPLYKQEGGEKGQSRIENLGELVTAARLFVPAIAVDEQEPISDMAAFLTHAVLESGEVQAGAFEDSVQMMTIHASKGLEFPAVFVTGLEEEMFPSRMSMNDLQRLEEERRLMYVAMTRAKEHLTITHSESRRIYGEVKRHIPSRFLREIPPEFCHEVKMRSQISRPESYQRQNYQYGSQKKASPKPMFREQNSQWQIGQTVVHPKFGSGIILHSEGAGEHTKLQIQFDDHGSKWLQANIARLSVV